MVSHKKFIAHQSRINIHVSCTRKLCITCSYMFGFYNHRNIFLPYQNILNDLLMNQTLVMSKVHLVIDWSSWLWSVDDLEPNKIKQTELTCFQTVIKYNKQIVIMTTFHTMWDETFGILKLNYELNIQFIITNSSGLVKSISSHNLYACNGNLVNELELALLINMSWIKPRLSVLMILDDQYVIT